MLKLYQNKEWLEKKYLKEKLNTYQIAKLCRVGRTTIRRWMRKFNIPIRSRCEAQLLRYKESQQNKKYCNKEWLEKKYLIEKLSMRQIGKLCGVSFLPIQKNMKRFGISARLHDEAMHLGQANHCSLTSEAIEWINGELLGDGHLGIQSGWSARFSYGSKYLEYINYVSKSLDSFGIKRSGRINIDKNNNCYFYASYYYEELLPIRKKWYPRHKKIVPRDIELTPITCRQWYIGDGSLHQTKFGRSNINLNTQGLSILDSEWLVRKLNNLGFRTTLQPAHNVIHISTRSTKDFLDYIGSSPIECYEYKWLINKA